MKKIAAESYRDIDFSSAKRGAVIPAEPGKTKISIRIDNTVIEYFRSQVEQAGSGNYQTLMNDALVAFIQQRSVIDAVRQVEQRGLLDAGAHTGAVHEAIGDVGLTGVAIAGLGTPDEHVPDAARKCVQKIG